MNRIDQKLAQLNASGKKMLSPYITAGDPEVGLTVKIMHALVDSGADIIELGIPFSDPMAEGLVIQAAMERALVNGVTCKDVFSMVEEFRQTDPVTPIVLMGYMNPIEQYGYEAFANDAQHVGVDGMIIVDLPPEESEEIHQCWQTVGLYNIFLCSPTTTPERMTLINEQANGYLYYVSLKGVTGSNSFDLRSVQTQYKRRKAQTNLPLMVGFGIKTPEMAAKVANFADGVIVGAALIEKIQQAYLEKTDSVKNAAALIEMMRRAIDDQDLKHD